MFKKMQMFPVPEKQFFGYGYSFLGQSLYKNLTVNLMNQGTVSKKLGNVE